MSIVAFIVILAVIGVGLWLLNTYVPMAPPIKTILNVVVVACVLLWVLSVFGLLDGVGVIGPRAPVVRCR